MTSDFIGPPARFTVSEYLRLEAAAKERHEYRNGRIIAMAGGSPDHSLIIANVIRELGVSLKGRPCRVYDSNLRVRIPRTPLYTYPDVSVICGQTQFDEQDASQSTAINPRVIVEVLSKSTEADDRGEKFQRYLSLQSLEQYVLVSQDRPLVETFLRQDDGTWRFASTFGLDNRARLDSIETHLALSEVYAGVTFPPDDEQAQLAAGPTQLI